MSAASGVGGSVNLITKQATDQPLTEITTSYASTSQFGSHLDFGRRYGSEKELGFRFNGAYRDGTVEIDRQDQEIGLAALNVDYRGESVRLSADFDYAATNNSPGGARLTVGPGLLPAVPDGTTNYLPSWSYVDTNTSLAMVRGEVDLTKNITAYAAIGASDAETSQLLTNFRFLSAAGDIRATPFIQPLDRMAVSGQAGIRASLDTGPIDHAISIDASANSNETKLGNITSATPIFSNIYNPVFGPSPGLPKPKLAKNNTADLESYGFADTISILDKRIQFTAGIRRQSIVADTFDLSTGALATHYDTAKWTPAYMLVVKPWRNVSLYANKAEGLLQGDLVGTGFTNTGEAFPPYLAKQREVGVKVDWGTLTTTLAAFEITQPFLISVQQQGQPLPTALPGGEQRNRGLEFNVFGELTRDTRLLGGFMLMDAEYIRSQDGLVDGNRAYGVPEVQVNLGGEWDASFMRGLTLTGRMIYTGETFADSANLVPVDAWTRVDLGARYLLQTAWLKDPTVIRLAVENVFDKDFWAAEISRDSQVYLGAPRTYLLSATSKF